MKQNQEGGSELYVSYDTVANIASQYGVNQLNHYIGFNVESFLNKDTKDNSISDFEINWIIIICSEKINLFTKTVRYGYLIEPNDKDLSKSEIEAFIEKTFEDFIVNFNSQYGKYYPKIEKSIPDYVWEHLHPSEQIQSVLERSRNEN